MALKSFLANGARVPTRAIGAIACASLLLLTSCTAFQVATHSVDIRPADAPSGQYRLDQNHYSLFFDVDHLHYIRFVSRFDRVLANLQFDSNWTRSQVNVVVDAASIDTNVTLLDKILAGGDMFDAQRYPHISFNSTAFQPTSQTTGTLFGRLTVRDKSIPVTLDVVFNGASPDPLTHVETLGFSATGHFSRATLGLANWFPAIGDDVRINIQAEFIKTNKIE